MLLTILLEEYSTKRCEEFNANEISGKAEGSDTVGCVRIDLGMMITWIE